MTCQHGKNDPSCSSHKDYERYNPRPQLKEMTPETPDKEKYSIEMVERVGQHLVLKVKYPNCKNCAYEGNKIMVFLNVSEIQALRWKQIDPHFRDPKIAQVETQAPSPSARFPGSDDGWFDAINYAKNKKAF